jgi:hypothetical protein
MYRALKDLGHEVDLYAAHLDEGAWQVITTGVITNGMGVS